MELRFARQPPKKKESVLKTTFFPDRTFTVSTFDNEI